MKPAVIRKSALDEAAAAIAAGGVIAFPTDTVYGLGCAPADRAAVERIYALKRRDRRKPLILLAADIADLPQPLPAAVQAAAARFFPGALTVLTAAPPGWPPWMLGGGTLLGLRVPDHEGCRELLRRTGPLATTSANSSGEPAYDGSAGAMPAEVDVVLDDGPTRHGIASTVVDLSTDPPRMLRAGAVTAEVFAQWYRSWKNDD